MDKITINNLFPSASTTDNKPLDVYSLYNPEANKIKNNINFSVDKLIQVREDRRIKTVEQYKKIFNLCLAKIDSTNKMGLYELVYEIPLAVYRYPDYNPVECIEYLNNKLKILYMDTKILSISEILISWTNIQENRRKKTRD